MALIDKASLLMVPSTYEDGTLYNVLPSGNKAPDETGNHNGYDQTRADFSFTRGSNLAATRVNADGLIEKGRENLLLQSNQFDTTWYNSNSTETGGQPDKDGGTNAWLLTKTSTNGGIRQNNTTTGVQTFSFYAKAADSNWVKVNNLGSSAYSQANFDLVNGVVGTTAYIIDAKIEDVGNGWFRCITTYNATLVNIDVRVADSDNVVSGTSGSIYIQNAQLEKGLVATDYIETGATTATAGVLENTPRIDYSSGAGALLLEPLRSNLITQSEYFNNWTKVDTTLTHNYGISPEGVRNSTRVQFADDTAYMYIAPGGTSSGTYASSIYIKGTAGETIKFGKGGNIATGAMHTLTGDWQRVEHITTDVGLSVHISTYGGSTARDIEIYGCQLEAGSYASSYIPTYGSAASRSADDAESLSIPNIIDQDDCTAFIEYEYGGSSGSTGSTILGIHNGTTTANRIQIVNRHSKVQLFVAASGSTLVNSQDLLTSLEKGDKVKIALAIDTTGIVAFANGTKIYTSSAPTFNATMDDLYIGSRSGVAEYGSGEGVKEVGIFNEALSDAECVTLTTL